MKVLLGYFVVTLIGKVSGTTLLKTIGQNPAFETCFSASQNMMSRLHRQPRRLQLRRNDFRVFDLGGLFQRLNLVPSPHTRAHASASTSSGIAGGLTAIRLSDLIGGNGLLAGHVGVQPQRLPSIAVRRSPTIVRPRTLVLGQGLQAVSTGGVRVPSQVTRPGLPSGGVGTTMLFDTPDPNTPDTPDFVYLPRSIMRDVHQIEAIRNNAEADGVVFV